MSISAKKTFIEILAYCILIIGIIAGTSVSFYIFFRHDLLIILPVIIFDAAITMMGVEICLRARDRLNFQEQKS